MADDQEKTEEPTSRKIEKAREEGNVAKSQEISGFVSLVVSFVVLYFSFGYIVMHLEGLYVFYHSYIDKDLTPELFVNLTMVTAREVTILMIPMVVAVTIAGIIGNVAQFGFLFSFKPLEPKLEKIDPVKGLKNLFSIKKLTDGIIVTLKVLLALLVGFAVFFWYLPDLKTVALFNLYDQMEWFADRLIILIAALLLLFFFISVTDLVIKRYQYFKGLRMSIQEVKDEHKQMEGDPKVKARIRQVMMQAAMKRMMQEVPKADVVVTNPTHYAVALRYNTPKDRAPRVVAKGVDHLAQRIKEVARENLIQIVENPPLARELYKKVDVDREIPEELYKTVAEVLAYVHKVENRTKEAA